jgi:hypothetical protein
VTFFFLYHHNDTIFTIESILIETTISKNGRGNQEWTIQRDWQHWLHKTQDEDKQNTTPKTEKAT